MENSKKDSEILAEVYRNARLARQSIEDILPAIKDEAVRREVLAESKEYERIGESAARLAAARGIQLKEPNPIKRAMMWSAIKMNTLADNSSQHIAQMMIRGTVTGITSLRTTRTDGAGRMDSEIAELIEDLIELEEGFEGRLKTYL